MKIMTVLTASLACCIFAVQAQDITEKQRGELQDARAGNPAQAYSEAESIAHNLSLDLLALNNPRALDGIAVLDMGGREIGTVTEITRNSRDQSLHAIISLATGARAALPLKDVSLEALAYYDPAQSLSAQPYDATQFDQISEYQAGHSARGSLGNPAEESPASRDGRENASVESGEPAQQAAIERQAEADSAQLQIPAHGASSGSAAGTAYTASGSSIAQLALTNPDALQGTALVDETGTPLGVLVHVARNIADQALYAVIDMNGEAVRTAVKLDALSIGKLGYAGEAGSLQRQDFDEDDFVPVAGQ